MEISSKPMHHVIGKQEYVIGSGVFSVKIIGYNWLFHVIMNS